jgi:RNA-directed DNA polymerase
MIRSRRALSLLCANIGHSINTNSGRLDLPSHGCFVSTDRDTQHLEKLLSDQVLDAAYEWLCYARRDYPASADVWDFRRKWAIEKTRIKAQIRAGQFRFDNLSRIEKADGSEIELWAARGALVLKALSLVLADLLPSSPRCTHLKNHGGAKAAVRLVQKHIAQNRFVMRTDVKSYYASIDHVLLMERLARFVTDKTILGLCGQYLKRTAEKGGWFWSPERGISLGCPLSPLMGAFFLLELDTRMARSGLFYVRFMDDILVLAPTRAKLRSAVRIVNAMLASLWLEKHPDKTFIGRIERGFDFLGYHFGPGVLRLADATMERFVAHATRLYEQGRLARIKAPLLGTYVRRWRGWAKSGVVEIDTSCTNSLALSISAALSLIPASVTTAR